ncbi:MAG: serine acetyltransferase [Bacteroidetes bacterium]|nr:serine acetyltransferase [Bacteroidota bacterium]
MNKLINHILERNQKSRTAFPNKKQAVKFIEQLFDTMYINTDNKYDSIAAFETEFSKLGKLFNSLIGNIKFNEEDTHNWKVFSDDLFKLYQTGMKDAEAIFLTDPAANSLEEVTHTYPGFYAIAIHRISHYLWQKNVKELARLFSENTHSKTGIDIHPGAEIGEGFAIDHGTGIVIGETTIIGRNVKIYQGVTLGSFSVSKESIKSKRHPTIEDDVVIYSNATILGGGTQVGRGSIIGGNVWLTYSVPKNSVVFHQMEIKVKDNNPFPEPINFVI